MISRPPAAPDAALIQSFLDAFWDRHPVTATFAGAAGHDGEYPDWSPEGLARSLETLQAERNAVAPALLAAEGTLARAPWPDSAPLVDLRLADVTLEIEIAERAGEHFHRGNPSLAIGEAAFGLVALMARRDLPLAVRHTAAIERLAALPLFLAGARRSITRAIPAAWRDRACRECEGATILVRDGAVEWLGDAAGTEHGRAAIQAAVGAIAHYDQWLRGDAPSDADNRVAVGAEHFAMMLARGHWSSRSIADWRLEVVARLDSARGTLASMAGALAGAGWPAVEARLSREVPSAAEYIPALDGCWRACRQLAESQQLVHWPDAPVRFAPTATFTRAAAPFLYYLPYRCPPPLVPTGEHVHEVAPLVTGPDGERVSPSMSRAQIKLNHVVHHAALGHQVQNWHAARSASLIGRVSAVDGASRIAMFVGGSLAEGWACYATDLMDEAGFLSADERVAEQHTRVRLLGRALMDIDLHTGQRSLDEVATFYALEVGMGDAAARNEAVKNSMFPGAAIMYWLGLDGIHALRIKRQREQRESFDLRAFHHEILAMGAIPVPMIAERMAWGGR